MRRSTYEKKEESYIVHERRSWDYPSHDHEEHHEVSNPSIHKMVHKPSYGYSKPSSYGHHDEDDMVLNKTHWDESHGWCGTHHLSRENSTLKNNEHQAMKASRGRYGLHGADDMAYGGTHHLSREDSKLKKNERQAFRGSYRGHHGEDNMAYRGTHWDEASGWSGGHRGVTNNNNFTMKKNEHQAMGAKSILRPPLGSVNPPPPNRTMYEGPCQGVVNQDERQYYYQGKGSREQAMSMMVNNSGHNSNWREASEKYEDYNHGSNNHNKWMKASKNFEDDDYDHHGMKLASKKHDEYDHQDNAQLPRQLESLIKGLRGLGGEVHKIEVIEYERRSMRGGVRTYHQFQPIYNS